MKLYCRKYGSGKPVVILHGLFGMSDNWVTFGKKLAENFEVYIPDQRNHGRSPHDDLFNYDVMQQDLDKFVKDHQLKDLILIGHSMGGKVAMHYTMNNPASISKLIVLDISPVTKTPSFEIMQIIEAINNINITNLSSREDIKEKLGCIIKKKRILEFLLKNVLRQPDKQYRWKFNVDAISANLPEIALGIETDKTYEGPALFIGGE
jgi:pimeloyl-ACP methyl ester carboxylesterase